MAMSRRKYSLLLKFFKDVISNPALSMRTRLQAAARLDGILERNERAHELEAARKERAAARAVTLQPVQPAQEEAIAPTEAPSEPAPDDGPFKAVYAELFPAGKTS